jgi:hypothetical protein
MNYQKTYSSLIAKAQARTALIGYKERHHILPRSMGGTDDASNLVNLTAREHFIAHYLLAKIHGGSQWLPVLYFKNGNKYNNSRLYEAAKIKVIEYRKQYKPSDYMCSKLSLLFKGKKRPPFSKEWKANMKKGQKGKQFSDEHKKKLGDRTRGTNLTSTHKHRIGMANSLALKGKNHSVSHNQNISVSMKLFHAKKKFLVVSTQYLTSAEWC